MKSRREIPGCFGVAALIVILYVGLNFYHLYASAKVASRKTGDLSNAKQIATSLAIYQSDNEDKFPPEMNAASLKRVLKWYLKNDQLEQAIATLTWNVKLGGLDSKRIPDPGKTWLCHSTSSGEDGRYIVVYADSHAVRMSEQEMVETTRISR